ncbi:MAG: hypothetical protein LUG52_10440 [Clostridia bacterium]|nr:hypothetical protein [Clostridia bacterium]
MGLVRAPIGSLGGDFRIEIKPKGVLGESYVFSKERLNCEGITYLPIGKRPFEKYTLGFQNGNEKLREFWPKEIEGVDPNGTLFEKTSGKKLICDADVEIGKEYYLLKRNYLHKKSNGSIRVEQIAKQQFGWERWYLYLVSADAFDEESARFYLDFHCRLTDSPVSMQPIWPLFVEGNYLIKHNESSIYMLVTGNVMAFATFPPRKVRRFEGGASQMKLCRASCSARQQLISTGRTRALQYIYFWKEPLDKEGMQPTFSVTDLKGADAAPGVTDTLPYKKTLIFKSEFDGEIIIYKNNFAVDKRKISADKYVETDGLVYGLSVELVIGLDVVWKIEFKKRKSVVDDEAEIMRQIADVSGAVIPTPHCLWNIMLGMGAYPNVCRWIKKCIRSGSINEKSYRRLQNIYKRVNMNREGDTI